MKLLVATVASVALITSAWAQGNQPPSDRGSTSMAAPEEVRRVAPALDKYTHDRLLGDVWKRPGLGPRDRSVVTIAAIIARNQTTELPYYLDLALDHGVKPREISEIITHLAFYSGWGHALSAVGVAKGVFARRQIGIDQLPQASPSRLPLNETAEAERAARVSQQFGAVAPGIVQYTTDVLFRDLWLRPDLAARDRSLVTVSALIASGHVGQIPYTSTGRWTRVSRRLRPLKSSRTWPSTPAGPTRSRRCRSQRRSSRNVRNKGNRSRRLLGASGGHELFEPGDRTAWAHQLSRATLIVTADSALVQEWAAQRRRSAKATSCKFRPARNTGMAPLPRRA
jgi:4-carboxymuconolactone decarboxylase